MAENPTEWTTLERVLDELLDANAGERDRILAALQKDEPTLAERAERLLKLALDQQALPNSIGDAAPELFRALGEADIRAHLGEQLGAYRITEVIQRGGMGMVFRGERTDGAFEQSVAIKLIPASIATETARAFFERERQHLARLEHPNIARIIDAGVAANNTPYYVMEFVDGAPVDKYLARTGATRRQILDYFLELCDAVAYCHRSMIVHGDIKPGNVFVADGRVRLLDFGIGRLLEETDLPESLENIAAYSPGYAAPEQVRGEAATIQSDVYSLGRVLQQLFPTPDPASRSRAPRLPVDIRAIIERCLAENPANRYESAGALRDDIKNHLRSYPVTAREPTRRYRAGRFVRRNKLLVASATAVLVALGTGLGAALWQYDIARTEATRAEQVKTFLTRLFERADPIVAGERELTLRELVDDAAVRLDTALEDMPDVRAELTQLIGNAYFGIGDFDDALKFHRQALELWRAEASGPSIEVVRALNAVGADYSQRGEYGKAEAMHRQAIDLVEHMGLAESIEAATSWTHLGASLVLTDPQIARESMLRAHEINLLVRPNDRAALARSLGNVATGYRAERNIEESARYHEQALAMAEADDEILAPEILTIRCNLALDYGTLGRHEDALIAQERCNKLTIERLGIDHPANVPNLNNLGALDIRMGNLGEAELAYLEALRIAEAKLPPTALERMASEINYCVVLWHSGRTADAEDRLRDLLDRMETSVGAAHPASGRVRSILGRVILERGDAETGSRFIENSIDGLTPYWRADALLWLAEARLAMDEREIAAELARESLSLRRSIPHYTNWQIAEAEFVLARATNDTALLNAVADTFDRELPAGHFRRGNWTR
jgi:serine/threonine-protein kinase